MMSSNWYMILGRVNAENHQESKTMKISVELDLIRHILRYCEDKAIYDKLGNYGDFYYKLKKLMLSEAVKMVAITAEELRERFILRLENAGFNPYMFNEGLVKPDEVFQLNKVQALALGMSEAEFNSRVK